MKRILTLSFIIFSPFITLQSWALPACPSNQNAYYHNCFGTYIWDSGNKYVGEWKNNLKHGRGTHTHPEGDTYVGEFRNDYLNGFAIRYDKNGNILKEGIWKDDEFQYAQKQSSGSSNSSSKLNKYKDFCKEIGFTPGTEKFGECVLKAMEVE